MMKIQLREKMCCQPGFLVHWSVETMLTATRHSPRYLPSASGRRQEYLHKRMQLHRSGRRRSISCQPHISCTMC